MKAKTLITISSIVVALALIKIFFLSPKQTKAAGPQAGKGPVVTIKAVVVKTGNVENKLILSGTVLANEEAILKPEVSGKIISMQIKEGGEVEKGQLLVKINDADLQAQLAKQVALQKINEEKERDLKALLAVKGVSQEEYDLALSTVQQTKADIDLTQAQIAKTEIHAPFNGVIGLKNVSEGNNVSPTDIIASVQQLNPIKIDFSVPEKYTAVVHLNDTVLITIQGTGHTYVGKVYAIDPKIDAATRSLKIRAICENSKREIFPGSYAQVTLILKSDKSVIMPTMAVIPDLHGQKTYIVRNGKAVSVLIETGIRNDTSVEVLKGLKEGDTVATEGIMALKPNVQVKIQGHKK
ncbi:MAG TPA: efflux RND transporter periplasmic adaptor subunit [Bacteroidia bacterium]|jgi:membrane fusion protein (multidrug efflux system)|nr:efflux RND transporter periplasmic adaptor subunit [Bacteroidia bacterium]